MSLKKIILGRFLLETR